MNYNLSTRPCSVCQNPMEFDKQENASSPINQSACSNPRADNMAVQEAGVFLHRYNITSPLLRIYKTEID